MAENGCVKKETVMLIALGCLVTGFLAGIVFSVYKGPMVAQQAGGGAPQQQGKAPQGQGKSGGLSSQQAAMVLQFEQQVQKNPQDADTWAKLGNLWFDTDNFEKAIAAYSKYLEIRPDDPGVLTDIGVMFRRVGQYDKALASFDRAIAANPTHQQSRFNRGVVLLFDMNKPAEGIAAWEELARVNPNATAPDGRPLAEVIKEYKQKSGMQ